MPRIAAPEKKARPSAKGASATTKRSLAIAFQTFTHAAESLEKSYSHLQSEVLRLRFELERTNRDLTISLEENARMRRYLASVVEALPCGIVVVDRQGAFRMMNPESRRLLARRTDSLPVGRELLPEKAPKEVPEEAAELALPAEVLRQSIGDSRSSSNRAEREVEIKTIDGTRLVGFACAVLGEGDSEDWASESVFVLRDITEERRQAAERETTRRKESLAQMATLLAHEIRNPLGSLELFAGLLADATAAQPELRRWTDHIQAGLRSLSATVNNVLQFHSQPAPQLEGVNLGRLLRESVDFLRPLARQTGQRIELHNALGEIEIPADAHRLQQVFFNLALNAFRAMSIGGVLSVRLGWNDDPQGSRVRVDFQDTGRGIASEHLPKIFDAGFTTHNGNPGLGLAVCRTVVEQHGGQIHASSEMGKGANFSVMLPRVAAAGGEA